MKIQTLLLIAVLAGVVSCAEKQQPANAPAEDAAVPATESVAAPAIEPTIERGNPEFIEHMHNHADYLDSLNFALAEGDIVGAMTPAYWLSRHDAVEGVPEEFQPYIQAMHAAALDVERAKTLESARAAADRIEKQCEACHKAAGVMVE